MIKDFGPLFFTEWFKGPGDADILLQMRNIRNTQDRSRYGVAQDVGQQKVLRSSSLFMGSLLSGIYFNILERDGV